MMFDAVNKNQYYNYFLIKMLRNIKLIIKIIKIR